jgi:tRNA pseudouridine55 synthase
MFGLLNLDKPAGVTARDVVNRVQRLVRPEKVGHAGTLDPLATGVLVVGIGQATRLVEYVQRLPKTYRGTFLLGRTSDTEDIEGQVRELPNPPVPTCNQMQSALPRFVGSIEQSPPAYSALRVAGQRAYDLARKGEAVELAPRAIEIFSLELLSYDYPELTLLVRCGGGTYVRTLGRDIARSLGTDAVMSALRREAIGGFSVTTALPAEAITLESIQASLLPPILAVGDMPQIVVSGDEARRLGQGQPIANRWHTSAEELAAVTLEDRFVAIVAPLPEGNLRATKNFGTH